MKTPSERAAEALLKAVGTRGNAALTKTNVVGIIETHTLAGEMERLLAEAADKIDEALSPTVWGTLSSRFETAVASELKAVVVQTRALLAKLQSK